MQKYKICPSCQAKNEPMLFECLVCETDLTGIKITDEETEKVRVESTVSAPVAAEEQSLVRVCDCGEKNPSNARKCGACHEDISDIMPTPDKTVDSSAVTSALRYLLSSLDGKYVYQLSVGETVVGRENAMSDYLVSKYYVSRAHAKFTIENDILYIENLSNTNPTYIDNKQISGKTKLEDGAEIGLGGTNINGRCQAEAAYFLVRCSQCM